MCTGKFQKYAKTFAKQVKNTFKIMILNNENDYLQILKDQHKILLIRRGLENSGMALKLLVTRKARSTQCN